MAVSRMTEGNDSPFAIIAAPFQQMKGISDLLQCKQDIAPSAAARWWLQCYLGVRETKEQGEVGVAETIEVLYRAVLFWNAVEAQAEKTVGPERRLKSVFRISFNSSLRSASEEAVQSAAREAASSPVEEDPPPTAEASQLLTIASIVPSSPSSTGATRFSSRERRPSRKLAQARPGSPLSSQHAFLQPATAPGSASRKGTADSDRHTRQTRRLAGSTDGLGVESPRSLKRRLPDGDEADPGHHTRQTRATRRSADPIANADVEPPKASKRRRLDVDEEDLADLRAIDADDPESAPPTPGGDTAQQRQGPESVMSGDVKDAEARLPSGGAKRTLSKKAAAAKGDIADAKAWSEIQSQWEQTVALRKREETVQKSRKPQGDEESDIDDTNLPRDLQGDTDPSTVLKDAEYRAWENMKNWFCTEVVGVEAQSRCLHIVEAAQTSSVDQTGSATAAAPEPKPTSDDLSLLDPAFARCVYAYQRAHMARTAEAATCRQKLLQDADLYCAWQDMKTACDGLSKKQMQLLRTSAGARGRQALSTGVGKKTFLWDWLVAQLFPPDSLRSSEERGKARRMLRDLLREGQRLDKLRGAFGNGILAFLPHGAGRHLRNYSTLHLNAFVDVLKASLPDICLVSDLVENAISSPATLAVRSFSSDNPHVQTVGRRVLDTVSQGRRRTLYLDAQQDEGGSGDPQQVGGLAVSSISDIKSSSLGASSKSDSS